MSKKKTNLNDTNHNYYYQKLLNHAGVTIHDRGAKNYLLTVTCFNILLLIIILLFFFFPDSKIVIYFTNNSLVQYYTFLFTLIYTFLCITSFNIYHQVSLSFEAKNKYEFNLAKTSKCLYFLFYLIHAPWIFTACAILKLLKKTKLDNLKALLPLILCGYLYFLMFGLIMLQNGIKLCDKLTTRYPYLINDLITDKTYIYLLVFLTIIIGKHIPTLFLTISIKPFIARNSLEYKKIFRQYHLLNYYFLLLITVFLQALNFTGAGEVLVDALFYTTTALTLISDIKSKATFC